jgi:hypothetical protein
MPAGLEQMGRLAVPQRVARSAFLDTAGREGGPEGLWHTGSRQRHGGSRHADTPPSWGRKKPDRMAVGSPGLAEALQGAQWPGDITGCGAFAQFIAVCRRPKMMSMGTRKHR